MRLPIELIVVLLLAKVLQSPELLARANPWSLAAGMGLMAAIAWLLPWLGWFFVRRRRTRFPDHPTSAYEFHAGWITTARCVNVALYGTFLFATGWSEFVESRDGLDAGPTLIGDDLLQILPYLLATAISWAADYRASKAVSSAAWTLGDYLRHHARGLSLLLAPWLLMGAIFDSQRYWPFGLASLFDRSIAAQLAFTAALFVVALSIFPLYLVRLWPHERLPDGALRSRLEEILKRARVRCRDLVVWKTGRGRIPNAAVMGLVAPLRYVAFTDALLLDLAPDEIEAVLAHEAGHVRHHHMAFYAFFAAAFTAVIVLTAWQLELLLKGHEQDPLALLAFGALLSAVTVLYWRYAFGYLSRRFERQADVAACELVGSAAPLAAALDKLAAIAGSPREASSWRHYSVARRVAFLQRAAADPAILGRHHRHVRRVKLAAGLIFLAVLVLALLAGLAQN